MDSFRYQEKVAGIDGKRIEELARFVEEIDPYWLEDAARLPMICQICGKYAAEELKRLGVEFKDVGDLLLESTDGGKAWLKAATQYSIWLVRLTSGLITDQRNEVLKCVSKLKRIITEGPDGHEAKLEEFEKFQKLIRSVMKNDKRRRNN